MSVLVGLFLFVLTVIVLGILFSLPVMWLWNWLMPYIFQLPELSLFQAFGLLLLCGFLFKTSNVKGS